MLLQKSITTDPFGAGVVVDDVNPGVTDAVPDVDPPG